MAADTKHPVFLPPANANAKVWRYMDFTNYIWTLECAALYFSRIDLLGDPFEGTTTAASNAAIMKSLAWPPGSEQRQKDWSAGNAKLRRHARRAIFVNCWHMNDHESEALWRLYAKSDQAIAIQSYVSPNCPSWYEKLAERLTQSYGYSFPITRSRLSEEPVR